MREHGMAVPHARRLGTVNPQTNYIYRGLPTYRRTLSVLPVLSAADSVYSVRYDFGLVR